jgi:hypothetical protein
VVDGMLQERFPVDLNKSFGNGISYWLKPGTQTGRKDQCFHILIFIDCGLPLQTANHKPEIAD